MQGETRGLVLFARNHKEKDKLVKIFTESSGKQMFYVRGANRKNNPFASAIFPFTEATYIGNLREDGLSFLNAAKNVHSFKNIQLDIFISAYATYILNLVDVAIEDRVYDPALYGFTKQALQLLDDGKDAEIITNIFEIQILHRFGVSADWNCCAICGETRGKFDFSSRYHGVLCEKHFHMDERRYHADPRAIYFLRMFANITYDQISSISLKKETKLEIRQVIDELYDEYVGIHLKSKKFIEEMDNWKTLLTNE
jgi:DNA repair protein RecO (recombination protein O)